MSYSSNSVKLIESRKIQFGFSGWSGNYPKFNSLAKIILKE